MSDEPEFEEVQITAADARRAKMASALMLGAVLPGMADVLPEASAGDLNSMPKPSSSFVKAGAQPKQRLN